MNRKERAKPRINRMAKRQHAALTKQHVVGQRKDDHDAHLAQQGNRKTLAKD